MTPTLALASPQVDRNSTDKPATEVARKPKLWSSYSLLIVMVVYLLFGVAGFFAAAQML